MTSLQNAFQIAVGSRIQDSGINIRELHKKLYLFEGYIKQHRSQWERIYSDSDLVEEIKGYDDILLHLTSFLEPRVTRGDFQKCSAVKKAYAQLACDLMIAENVPAADPQVRDIGQQLKVAKKYLRKQGMWHD